MCASNWVALSPHISSVTEGTESEPHLPTVQVSPYGMTLRAACLVPLRPESQKWLPRYPASMLGVSICHLLPLGFDCVSSHLTYEWSPDKDCGPPAIIMPTLQTSKLSLGGPPQSHAQPLLQMAMQGSGLLNRPTAGSVLGSEHALPWSPWEPV